jgi:hypothetical protein
MDTRIINHRRDRQQTRRILADLRVRCRDLTRSSFFQGDLDPIDQRPRMLGLPHSASIGGRH